MKCELYYFLFVFHRFQRNLVFCRINHLSYQFMFLRIHESGECVWNMYQRCRRPCQMVEITVLVWGLHQLQMSLNIIFLNLWLTYMAWHRISGLIKEFCVCSICTNRIYYLKKFKITSYKIKIMQFVFGIHWLCIFIIGTVNLDYQCEYAFGLVCVGLDWAIQNLLVQFRTTANYVFCSMWQGNPSIQSLSKSNS